VSLSGDSVVWMKNHQLDHNPALPDTSDRVLNVLGLDHNPFSMSPDIVNFYSSTTMESTVVEVLQMVETRMGFALLYGDVGLGKTTVSRRILFELDRRGIQTSLVFNTFFQGAELLAEINRDFGNRVEEQSLQGQMNALNRFLLEQRSKGNNCAIIIDDAQNLSVESLELVRQVSNMETGIDKIVQIVLIGQPELEEKLNLYELRQLKSRIVLKRAFKPYSLKECAAYVHSKLARGGDRSLVSITKPAVREVYRASGGSPRRINVIMMRCLYAAVAMKTRQIDRKVVDLAIDDMDEADILRTLSTSSVWRYALAATVLLGMAATPVIYAQLNHQPVLNVVQNWLQQGRYTTTNLLESYLPGPASVVHHFPVVRKLAKVTDDASIAVARSSIDDYEAELSSYEPIEAPMEPQADAPIQDFLDSYGLGSFAAEFGPALESRNFGPIAGRILEDSGQRLVLLPAEMSEVQSSYATLEIPQSDTNSAELLLFWKPSTWNTSSFDSFYRKNEVMKLQQALADFGSYSYFVDGIAGDITTTAIELFQTNAGLPLTGVPDTGTLFLLEFLNQQHPLDSASYSLTAE
jgi:general secretion pathway protein A